jgi:hypothetical protein
MYERMSMEQWWNDTDRGNWSTERKTLYSVGGRWMNHFGGLVLIVDNRIPDKRQYPSATLFTTNSDIYSIRYWPPQPHHDSSSRRTATSCKHVTFSSVGHSMSATPYLPIQSTGYGTHHFQDHAPSQTQGQMLHKAPHRRCNLYSETSCFHKGSAPLAIAQILTICLSFFNQD